MTGPTAERSTDDHLDLVPMIDCIMLLLLFFMMTTKFTGPEKAIAYLLPTDQGQPAVASKPSDPPPVVTISIYPAGMTRGFQPSEYLSQLNRLHVPGQVLGDAAIRVGNREPIIVSGRTLTTKGGSDGLALQAVLDQLHRDIGAELAAFEKAGLARNRQDTVLISCFSGLSWKFPLVVFDAVRAYEGQTAHIAYTGNPDELLAARPVTFTPPRIRDYTANELGNELYEIIHAQ
jgi:Biopolymer transport protein ExbD/TolR